MNRCNQFISAPCHTFSVSPSLRVSQSPRLLGVRLNLHQSIYIKVKPINPMVFNRD